jgi:cell division protein FtsW
MSRKLTWDPLLFGAAILAIVVGLVMIYSASAMISMQKTGGHAHYFLFRQITWLAAGSVLMAALMFLDTRILRDQRVIYGLLGGICVALVLVLFQAPINGTHRWFVLPWGSFQPAELAKPIVVLFLAAFLARREERIDDLTSTLLPFAAVLALVTGLILLQPDFGTAAMIFAISSLLVFVAGISWRRIVAFALPVIPLLVVLMLSADYRRERLLSFLNPEADPLGKGFQAMQSLIAIGTGGVAGAGIGNGRQKLFFLPEPHTDFIFSIIGEELGFLGGVSLIVIFAFIVWRGFRIVAGSRDRFTFYAALGLTLLIGVQALFNMSVALCLLPTKGLPLPLVSYGGSSLLASMVTIGVLLNLSQQTE